MSKKKRGFLSPYRNYSFINKDPIIDFARTAVKDSGKSYKQIHEGSNVATATLVNWFKGRTRRPQFATVAAVLLECGVSNVNIRTLSRRNSI